MLKKRLQELRTEKGLSQYDLAETLNLSRGQISNYELGTRQPDYEILTKLATFFDVTTDYLLGQNDLKRNTLPGEIEMKKIPIYSLSNSREKIFAQKNIIGWQAVSAELMDNHVAFLVADNSMSGSSILKDYRIIVKKQPNAEDGQIVVVEHEDEIIVRRIKYADNGIILYPDNSEYSPLLVNNNDLSIFGVVVQVVFDIN